MNYQDIERLRQSHEVVKSSLIFYLSLWLLQVFVILVGTNNHHSTVEEIVDGLETIVWTVYEKQPQSKIVILVSQVSTTFMTLSEKWQYT